MSREGSVETHESNQAPGLEPESGCGGGLLRSWADVEHLRAVMNRLPVGVLVVEGTVPEEIRVQDSNEAFAALVGARPQVGAAPEELPYGLWQPHRRLPLPASEWPEACVISNGRPISNLELHLRRPDGSWRVVLASASPVQGERGSCGAVVLYQDITPIKHSEAVLQESEAWWRLVAESADLGTFDQDLISGRLVFSPRYKALVGLPADQEVTFEQFLTRIFQGDRLRFLGVMQQALVPGAGHCSMEFRVHHPDNGLRWVNARGKACFIEAGGEHRPVRFLGTAIDITARKRSEERMQSLQELATALARALTPEEVAEAVVQLGARALRAAVGAMALPQAEGTELEITIELGLLEPATPAQRRFSVESPNPLAEAFRGSKEVIFDSEALWQQAVPELARENYPQSISAFAALPLIADGRTVGVVGFGFCGQRRFSAGDLAFLRAIAGQAAQAVQRARLYESESKALAEAQQASTAKDEFVALVSHELRNPLSAIQAGTFILRQTLTPEGKARRALEIVERNVRLQARLVNDLLDLSRLSRGKLQLQRAPLALDKVVGAAVQACEEDAQQAGLSLSCDVTRGLWVPGDFDRLQQVVSNLLSNAIKFTPPGGQITVRAEASSAEGSARLRVEDTGLGIDRKLLSRLFELFEQGEVCAPHRPGLGIGLALVKGIVEMHGGRVWAESDGVGRGSRFTIVLPLTSGPPLQQRNAPAGAASGLPTRVLLVEDNADTRTLIADALTLAGFDPQTAASGEEALELLRQEEDPPGFIICDIGLPGIDGYEVLRQARELPGLGQVPAFAVTGFGQAEDVRRGRQAGFAGHFVKPVDIGALIQRIREWIGPEE